MENQDKELSDKIINYLLGSEKTLKEMGKNDEVKNYHLGQIATAAGFGLISRNPVAQTASALLTVDLLVRTGNYAISKMEDKNAKFEEQPGIIGLIRTYLKDFL